MDLGKQSLDIDARGEKDLTLGDAIRRNAHARPHHPAILSSRAAPLTYAALQGQLDEIRAQLRHAGFDHRAQLGVLLPNSPETVLCIVAVACSAVAVPLDPRLTSAELDQRFEILRLDAILVRRGSTSEGRKVAEHHGIPIIEVIPSDNGELRLRLSTPAPGFTASTAEPELDAPAFILQTSGTTAQPKLIPFSHRNMLAAAARLQAWFNLTPDDRCLNVSPPYYSHGLKVTVFTPLLTGGSIAIPANAAAVDLSEWFDVLRPTWYSASPSLHRAVLDKAKPHEDALTTHTLRFMVSGGAPLPPEVREGLQDSFGVPVLEHYGSSEAAQIAANLPSPSPNKPGTCGVPWPGTLLVVGMDGEPLPAGERGEVWVRGPTVMSGYLDNPELNRIAFTEGWFRTGDIGSLDADGFLTLHGRLNEIINRGGEKISPLEIDVVFMRHPAVAEAAAFAVPHPRLGEDVAAAVVLRPGEAATPAELRQFLQSSLASYKIPRRILILDQLPRGITGKVQRRRLTQIAGTSEGDAPAPSMPALIPVPKNLESELLHLWRRLLKTDSLTVDDDFFESGGDSLLATEMLIEIERLVGHQISESILLEAATVRQLIPRLTGQAPFTPEPLTRFHTGGRRPPLILFHGDLSRGGLYVQKLLKLLGADQPVIAIAPHGLCGEPVPQTIEEMASDRLPLILAEQGEGPFLLAGNCNGALVAAEVARLLTAAGHKVDMLALIDPPTVSARPIMRAVLRLMKWAASPRRLAQVYHHLAMVERAMKLPPAQFLSKARRHVVEADFVFPFETLMEAYNEAMGRYLPAPLDIPTTFYAAAHDGTAWRRLSSHLDVVEVPGGHIGCVTTHVDMLVERLQQQLARVTRRNWISSVPETIPHGYIEPNGETAPIGSHVRLRI